MRNIRNKGIRAWITGCGHAIAGAVPLFLGKKADNSRCTASHELLAKIIEPGAVLKSDPQILALVALSLACVITASGQPRAIETAKSSMTVHVYKAGLLSALGHDHEVAAPIARGAVDVEGGRVELHVNAGSLRVEDPKVSDKDRGEIQSTMLGSTVLDAEKYKEIGFQSTRAEPAGTGAWKVSGNLTLHGETRPVSMEVREKNGHYTGACRLKISDFGIKPVKAAGGTVRVKDEVEIEFDIQLAR
jgi:polyisoprenoid-binding protein YceI